MVQQKILSQSPVESVDNDFAREFAWVAAFLIGLVALLIAFSSQLQPVWLDEVLLTDPAANLFLGNGFTSSAWYYQSKDEFWACNAPLHALLLFPWIKAFGLNVVAVRSLNYVWIAVSSLLIWTALYRTQWVNTVQNRIAAVAVIALSQGVSFNYVSGRYDCLAIALFSALFLICTFDASWRRDACLVVTASLVSMAGFHLVAYATLMIAMVGLFLGKSFIRRGFWILVGMTLGLFSVVALYASQGVLSTFIETVGGHALGDVGVPEEAKESVSTKVLFVLSNVVFIFAEKAQELKRWYFQDASSVFLMLAAVVTWIQTRLQNTFKLRSPLCFALLCGGLIPFIMGLFRGYPDYYTWMAIVPLTLGLFASLPKPVNSFAHHPLSLVMTSLLVSSMVVGLPTRLLPTVAQWQATQYSPVDAFVEANIASDERVFSDYGPYYAIKKKVDFVLFPTYLDMMSEAEKQQITTLLLDLTQFHSNHKEINLFEHLGGEWTEASEKLDTPQYSLRIYRRAA